MQCQLSVTVAKTDLSVVLRDVKGRLGYWHCKILRLACGLGEHLVAVMRQFDYEARRDFVAARKFIQRGWRQPHRHARCRRSASSVIDDIAHFVMQDDTVDLPLCIPAERERIDRLPDEEAVLGIREQLDRPPAAELHNQPIAHAPRRTRGVFVDFIQPVTESSAPVLMATALNSGKGFPIAIAAALRATILVDAISLSLLVSRATYTFWSGMRTA